MLILSRDDGSLLVETVTVVIRKAIVRDTT